MKLNDKIYDVLAYIGRIVLPALATLYIALADVWNLPFKVEISTTIMALDTFLNALLMISNNTYQKDKAEAIKDLYQGEE